MRKFFAMEADGAIPKGTAKQWADETPNIKKLPERVKKAMDMSFAKIALGLKKLPPVPKALVEQKESMIAASMGLKGMSPIAARVAKNPRLS